MRVSTKETRARLQMLTELPLKAQANFIGEWSPQFSIDSGKGPSKDPEQLAYLLWLDLQVTVSVLPAKDLSSDRRWISKIKVAPLQHVRIARPTSSQDRSR
jgi:hypothetical protein